MRTVLLVLLLSSPALAAGRIVFPPDDPCVRDVKRHYGAKGDGKTDDTDAIQKALDDTTGPKAPRTGVVYLPNGTYRLTKSLVVNRGNTGSGLGPWLFGETRDGVVLKLDDGARGVTCVLLTHPTNDGKTSANWFMRTVRNLTIDAGDNPDADGIRYMATNSGLLKDLKIKGNGKVGVNAGFIGESGPNSVQDVEIVGFDTGVRSHWCYGQTLSRITIRDCKTVGVHAVANVIGIEQLKVENTPQALFVDYPNDWHWWSGVVALVGGEFKTTKSDKPAVRNRGVLYARDLKAEGFARVLESERKDKSAKIDGTTVNEFTSSDVRKLFPDSAGGSLKLPVEVEPAAEWEADPTKWVCVDDFGAKAGDNMDDTAAVQKAIDAAVKAGKTTVYFRGIGGGDPNWYTLKGEVKVHGSVRHVLGLGFGRVLEGTFVVTDESADVVQFRFLDSFGGPPATVENRSTKKTVVVDSCGVKIVGSKGGKIFATNTPAEVHLSSPDVRMWARGLNPEGTRDGGLVRNDGGTLWVLGCKTEGKGLRYTTRKGGRTELLGCYEYTTEAVKADDPRAMFEVLDGQLSVAAVREVCFNGQPYAIKVREKRGAETKEATRKESPGEWPLWVAYPKGK